MGEEHSLNENAAHAAKKKRLKVILQGVFLTVTVAIGVWSLFSIVYSVGEGEHVSFGEAVRGINPQFFVLFLAVVLAVMALDTAKFCTISRAVVGKIQLATSAKVNFIGKYYDAVTPFATGGQPVQIYYLCKKGESGGNASAITLIRYIFSILSWIILGGALMIAGAVCGVPAQVKGGNLLQIAGWIGIGVNLIVPVFVLLFLSFPSFMTKLTVGVVKLGYKMKIVKDVDAGTARALKTVTDFKHAFKVMAQSPVQFILLIIVCFAEAAITFTVPYFVMKAFSCDVGGKMFTIMSLNAFAVFGASFIPTPGNSGVLEGMGAIAFSVATESVLIWSVLVWRFAVFYIYILIGFGITLYDVIEARAHAKKQAEAQGAAETEAETQGENETEARSEGGDEDD